MAVELRACLGDAIIGGRWSHDVCALSIVVTRFSLNGAFPPRKGDSAAIRPTPSREASGGLLSSLIRVEGRCFHDPRASRERAEERPAVGLRQDPRVEDHDDPPVGLRPDQPAEPLLELDDGLGHLVVDERVAAAAPDVSSRASRSGWLGT